MLIYLFVIMFISEGMKIEVMFMVEKIVLNCVLF